MHPTSSTPSTSSPSSVPPTQSPSSSPRATSDPLTQYPAPSQPFIAPTQSPTPSCSFVPPTQSPLPFPSFRPPSPIHSSSPPLHCTLPSSPSPPCSQVPPTQNPSSPHSQIPCIQTPPSPRSQVPPTQDSPSPRCQVLPTQTPSPSCSQTPPSPHSQVPPTQTPPLPYPPAPPTQTIHVPPTHTPPSLSPPSNPFQLLESLSRPVIHSYHPTQLPSLAHHAANVLDLVPHFTPLHQIPSFPKHNALRTDCKPIDTLLKGGIPTTAAIFEISGASGTGKSQLAMQLGLMACVSVQHGGLGGACVMLFTEGPPPVHRLKQIEAAVCRRKGLSQGSLLSRIVVERLGTADELQNMVISGKLGYLLRTTGARVVIVDSIAAVYRVEFGDPLERAVHLNRVAAGLKQEVGKVNGLCVCVNQVTTRIGTEDGGLNVPALGRVWGACVEHRVELRKWGGRRVFRIVESCCWEEGEVGFTISGDGVVAEERDK